MYIRAREIFESHSDQMSVKKILFQPNINQKSPTYAQANRHIDYSDYWYMVLQYCLPLSGNEGFCDDHTFPPGKFSVL